MTGFFWHIFIFGALGVFLVLIIYRILAIIRMPAHLRWELAPIPHEKGKNKYGGSYLEEHEWWHKKRSKSLIAVIIYMAAEIFLLRGVWKNNRSLWPFSFSMHIGIYLVILSVLLHVINALFIITGTPASILDAFRNIAAIVALAGYLLGSLGAIGLMLKRAIDSNFRPFGSFSIYFRLVFLAAVFISGVFAWFYTGDFASETSLFTRNLLTLDSAIAVTTPLTLHIIISLLFLVYLPLTDMAHFITKYFTYHAVRWDDTPLNTKMEAGLSGLKNQASDWSAPHIPPGKTWAEITSEKLNDEKTS